MGVWFNLKNIYMTFTFIVLYSNNFYIFLFLYILMVSLATTNIISIDLFSFNY